MGRLLPRGEKVFSGAARTVLQLGLLSISVIRLLSPFTQIQWKRLPSKLRCSEELLLSAVKASELLLWGRGQVNCTPCKITAPAVKYGLTLTHWILEIYLEMLCGFAPSVLEFALQAQGGGPAIPALCH